MKQDDGSLPCILFICRKAQLMTKPQQLPYMKIINEKAVITRSRRVLPSEITFDFERCCLLSSSESDSSRGFEASGLDFYTKINKITF